MSCHLLRKFVISYKKYNYKVKTIFSIPPQEGAEQALFIVETKKTLKLSVENSNVY